jgi:cytochrome c
MKNMLKNILLVSILSVGNFGFAAIALADGDVVAGEKVFKKCAACHVVDSDDKKVGPSLKGVFGRTAGTQMDFKYSNKMIDAGAGGLVWDEDNIAEYLADPKGYIKGNKMSFAGLKKPDEIENVIAYLKQFSPEE